MEDYNIDEQYKDLLTTILRHGVEKEDRTGIGTKSIFGYTIRWDMSQGYPLLTTKKMAHKSMVTELRWFLKGRTDLRWLLENNCHIWTGDAYSVYERTHQWELDDDYLSVKDFEKKILEDDDFSQVWGNLGFIYGKQWRDWGGLKRMGEEKPGIDQIAALINDIKENPDSRRLIVNAWNVSDLMYMKLPPCHYGFQIYTCVKDDGKRYISLMWNQRSVDTFLGLPFNIASYALLLRLIAEEVDMIPDQLIGNLGDCHLYLNHLEQAEELIKREPYCLPEIDVMNVDLLKGEFGYALLHYESHPTIKAPLNN